MNPDGRSGHPSRHGRSDGRDEAVGREPRGDARAPLRVSRRRAPRTRAQARRSPPCPLPHLPRHPALTRPAAAIPLLLSGRPSRTRSSIASAATVPDRTVIEFGPAAFAAAFAAGLLSFTSPCVLPLVPGYLSYVSGVGVDELGARPRRVALTTAWFVAFGAGAVPFGDVLVRHRRSLEIAAGAFIVFAGLVF